VGLGEDELIMVESLHIHCQLQFVLNDNFLPVALLTCTLLDLGRPVQSPLPLSTPQIPSRS
jgi:hypothetical protein